MDKMDERADLNAAVCKRLEAAADELGQAIKAVLSSSRFHSQEYWLDSITELRKSILTFRNSIEDRNDE